MHFRFEAVDLTGSTVDAVQLGEEFELRVHVRDARTEPQGIASAYLDVDYNPQLVTYVPASLAFGSDFGAIPNGSAADGVLDEVGSFIDGILAIPPLPEPVGVEETLFLSARFRATQLGLAPFVGNSADVLPLHSITMLGIDDGIGAAQVKYDSIEVTIVPEPAALGWIAGGMLLMVLVTRHRAMPSGAIRDRHGR
jgi:hypothetical protein